MHFYVTDSTPYTRPRHKFYFQIATNYQDYFNKIWNLLQDNMQTMCFLQQYFMWQETVSALNTLFFSTHMNFLIKKSARDANQFVHVCVCVCVYECIFVCFDYYWCLWFKWRVNIMIELFRINNWKWWMWLFAFK